MSDRLPRAAPIGGGKDGRAGLGAAAGIFRYAFAGTRRADGATRTDTYAEPWISE